MVLTHGFITKNTQVYVCVCVRESETWLRGIQLTCHCAQVFAGFDQPVFSVSVRFRQRQLTSVFGAVWVKPNKRRWFSETRNESELAVGWKRKGSEVKLNCQSKTSPDSSDKRLDSLQRILQTRKGKKEPIWLCVLSEMKQKQNCVNILPRQVKTRAARRRHRHRHQPPTPNFSPTQQPDNSSSAPGLPSSHDGSDHLFLYCCWKQHWLEFARRPFGVSLRRLALLAHYFTHALLFYQALFKVMLID